MMNIETLILAKEDKPIILTLTDVDGQPINFADMEDVIVELAINKIKVETYQASDDPATVIAVDGQADKCKILITRSQQSDWNTGLLEAQITTVINDSDFPDGRYTAAWASLYYCKKGF